MCDPFGPSGAIVGNLVFHAGRRCPGAAEPLPIQPRRRRARPKQEAGGAAGARSGSSVPSPPGRQVGVADGRPPLVAAAYRYAGGRRASRRVARPRKVASYPKAPTGAGPPS